MLDSFSPSLHTLPTHSDRTASRYMNQCTDLVAGLVESDEKIFPPDFPRFPLNLKFELLQKWSLRIILNRTVKKKSRQMSKFSQKKIEFEKKSLKVWICLISLYVCNVM